MMKSIIPFLLSVTIIFLSGCTSMSEKLRDVRAEISEQVGTNMITNDDMDSNLNTELTENHSEIKNTAEKPQDESLNTSTSIDENDYSDYSIPNDFQKGNSSNRRCVAYFTSWSAYARNVAVANIDPEKLTHINFAFANLNNEGEVIVGDSWVDIEKPFGNDTWETPSRGHFNQLSMLKKKYPHVKTLISVGGWTWSGNFSQVASTEQGRKKFAQSAVNFVTKYDFDGFDIDWEFPVEGGNNISHLPEDKQNYTLLLKETREAFDTEGKKNNKHYLLTIAGGPNVTFSQNTELNKMMEYLDFINVMTYDYHGGWENITGHNAPIFAPKDDTYSVQQTIDSYINSGVSPKDLNLGLAFYGRGWINVTNADNNGLGQSGIAPVGVGVGQGTWEGACFDYWDLEQNYIDKNGYKRYWDDKAKVPYLYNGNSFITYDDEESIKIKLDFAESKGLGGVMYWEFSGDKNFTLQNVITNYYGKFGTSETTVDKNENQKQTDTSKATEKSNSDTEKSEQTQISNQSLKLWNSGQTYNSGDIVTYNGHSYKARWWTQGEAPSDSEWGAWEKIT